MLFHAALELDEERRTALLDRECGTDTELRREVEDLLANAKASGVLDRSPARVVAMPVEPKSLEGQRVGHYVVGARIGLGGMGVVYDARQETPVQRRVALKVIHSGTHPDAALRFVLERQALARMSHPHIASVHDACVVDDGRPFIAMEFVEGIPLTDYCDWKRLDIPKRLELFVLVCQAIQHAHQKGIIHRDIKPSNVLVTEVDGKPARDAERSFRESWAVQKQRLKKDHPDLAYPMNNLARVYHDEGRYAEAEPLYRQALQLRRNALKAGHPLFADTMTWLGKLLTEKKQFQEAEPMLREAVAIREKSFKPDDWRLAEARSLLGGCLLAQKRFAEAEALLVDSYPNIEKRRGKSWRRTVQARERIVALYVEWDKLEQAARYR